MSDVPASQLGRAIAVGWNPQADIGAPLTGPHYDLCMKIEKEAGQGGASAPNVCEYLFFLQDALSRAPEVSVHGVEAGVAALGTSFQLIYLPATNFSSGRRDGVSQVRTTAFDSSCSCFNKYNGPPAPTSD